MRNKTKTSTWLWPIIIGLVAVILIAVIILRWGPRPAIAPGRNTPTIQPPAPLLQSVTLSPMVREYRGWMEVKAKPTITVKAPNADQVQISYWLVGEENGEWHDATKQADGNWSLTWPLKAGQQGHLIVKVLGRDNHQEQSETLNVLAVISK